MDKLPTELDPSVLSEWLKAGPWLFAATVIVAMLRRDLLARLFPEKLVAALPVVNLKTEEVVQQLEDANDTLREILAVNRRILEEALRKGGR